MIGEVSIRNFKCLRDVPIQLARFTIFVGPNASGKSSILQGVNLLCRAFRDQHEGGVDPELAQAVSQAARDAGESPAESGGNGAAEIPSRSVPPGAVELAAMCGGKAYRYRSHSPSSPAMPFGMGGFQTVPGTPWPGVGHGVASDLEAADWKQWAADQRKHPLPHSVLLRLEASRLIAETPSATGMMEPDGNGMHSALANMALNDPDSWQRLQADLRQIIPTIRRLRHTKTTVNQSAALLFDTVGADALPASQVSEGTLLVLGLLTALHASTRPSLVLLDDLDRGLHPRAQRELIALLRGLLEANPDLQLLATTHSPYMLDCMEPHEVRMTVLRDDGSTACAALAAHPEFQKWRDEMAPGEMWSLFGEQWLVEEGAIA